MQGRLDGPCKVDGPSKLLANIYLSACDRGLMEAFQNIDLYTRYLDDGFCHRSCSNHVGIFNWLSNWNESIRWAMTCIGTLDVPYLDLSVSFINGLLRWELFKKPQNNYEYLPRRSVHPKHVFEALLNSECLRILRRCDNEEKAHKHLTFFRNKMKRRGDCMKVFGRAMDAAKKKHAQAVPAGARPQAAPRKAFLKVPYSSAVNGAFIRNLIKKHSHLLSHSNVMIAWKQQPSMFRQLYKSNWLPPSHELVQEAGVLGHQFFTSTSKTTITISRTT